MRFEHIISLVIFILLMSGLLSLIVFDNLYVSLVLIFGAFAVFMIDVIYFIHTYNDWDDYD